MNTVPSAPPPQPRRSLAHNLLLGVGLSVVTVGLITLVVNNRLLRRNLDNQVRTQAQGLTKTIEFAAESLIDGQDFAALNRILQNYATLSAVQEIIILDPQGGVLARAPQSSRADEFSQQYQPWLEDINRAIDQGENLQTAITFRGEPALMTVLPFSGTLFDQPDGGRGAVIAILDLKRLQAASGRTFRQSTAIMVVGSLGILVLLALLSRRLVVQPLVELGRAVEASKETGIFPWPKTLGSREIYFLAQTFDRVLQQLATYDQLQAEVTQRKKVEAGLRASEARERSKSQALEQAMAEMQQLQMQMVQSEKMSSLGQLVAGVAHEINNPVNFIYGNLSHGEAYAQDLLKLIRAYQERYPNPGPEIEALIDEIDLLFLQEDLPRLLQSMQVGTSRIRDIVKSLRVFSRMDEAEVKEVDLHEGLESTLMILQHRLKAHHNRPEIYLHRHYGTLPLVECCAGQINQVFMNLLVNAIDALEDSWLNSHGPDPMTITLTTALEPAASETDSPAWVVISVQDNGPGVPEAVRDRLFDPFFTTKPVGKGTGMGLSISHEIIVSKHGGTLTCNCPEQGGTEFVVRIPTRFVLAIAPSAPELRTPAA